MALRSTVTGVGERILFHKAVCKTPASECRSGSVAPAPAPHPATTINTDTAGPLPRSRPMVQGVKYTCQFVAAPPKGAVGVQENFSLTAAGEGVTSGTPDLCRRRRSETSHLDCE
ncbi:predicted protein [Histoplasma capsulatum var. duboisii H88]|uniref:Predicted protein n=1 Tax=Ajellomyces capsulatus (strain H88) TaxID=544711 RepID=F0ULY3_AJEC8|nr:predicted protein [Histoplasma capsulatum var. duboisii H88]